MVTPGLLPLSEQFNVSPDTASSLIIGAYTFWTSVATFPIVAAASIWGRRPFYVISIAILFAANAGAFLAKVNAPSAPKNDQFTILMLFLLPSAASFSLSCSLSRS